jgi:hypothetical protein
MGKKTPLKRCPICGSEAKKNARYDSLTECLIPADKACCSNSQCRLFDFWLQIPTWQALPRRDESVAEVVREMRERAEVWQRGLMDQPQPSSREEIIDWADRLEATAEPARALATVWVVIPGKGHKPRAYYQDPTPDTRTAVLTEVRGAPPDPDCQECEETPEADEVGRLLRKAQDNLKRNMPPRAIGNLIGAVETLAERVGRAKDGDAPE